jgi:hypothetical protein
MDMLIKTATSLAFATACLTAIAALPAHAQMAGTPGAPDTEVVTNGPQGSPPPNWSARRNVIESQHYDRLLETNRKFRLARMRKECGPITDPQLHQSCLASFGQDEPYMGSSSARRTYRSESGR